MERRPDHATVLLGLAELTGDEAKRLAAWRPVSLLRLGINHDEHKLLRRWDLGAIGLEVILLSLFILGLVTGGGEPGQRAVSLILGGKYTAPFWALVVAVGLAVPFLVELLESRRNLKPTRVAPALILVGGLALRWIIVSAGQV